MSSKDDSRTGGSDAGHDAVVHRHDWEADDSLATSIVVAVAAVVDTPPSELAPLYETVDPDALESILSPSTPDSSGRCHLSFRYAGVGVSASSDGTIRVYPSADDA